MKEKIIGIDSGYNDVVSLDEAQSKGMMAFIESEEKNLQKLTEITDIDELKRISVMKLIQSRYNIQSIDDFLNDYMKLKISMQRKGRAEIVEILSASIKQKLQESFTGVLGRLRSGMG